jgi:hypothetical protein
LTDIYISQPILPFLTDINIDIGYRYRALKKILKNGLSSKTEKKSYYTGMGMGTLLDGNWMEIPYGSIGLQFSIKADSKRIMKKNK